MAKSHLRPRPLISNHRVEKFFFAFLKMFLTSFIKTIWRMLEKKVGLADKAFTLLFVTFAYLFLECLNVSFFPEFLWLGAKELYICFFWIFLQKRFFASLIFKIF